MKRGPEKMKNTTIMHKISNACFLYEIGRGNDSAIPSTECYFHSAESWKLLGQRKRSEFT